MKPAHALMNRWFQLNGSEQVVVIQASEFATYAVEAPQGQMASGGGTWTVARTLTQIPEPTSAALAMLTLTAFVGRSRRG